MKTEEQIKQNAEAYADQFVSRCFCGEWKDVVLNFTAGAHSRDEEIEELEERIHVLDMNLVEQQLENQHLSNPWISVKERLPLPEKMVIGTDGWYYYPVCYNKHDERWRIQLGQIFGMDVPISFITHWMPIPKLEKGE